MNSRIHGLLDGIARAGSAVAQNESGARERLLDLAYALAAAVELPSEAIQRIGWAEASAPPTCFTPAADDQADGARSPPAWPC